MTLNIFLPSCSQPELEWICAVLLRDFIGITYHLQVTDDEYITIEHNGLRLELSAEFFLKIGKGWLSQGSLPIEPLRWWDVNAIDLEIPLVNQPLPILFGKPEIEISNQLIRIGVDIFGTAFFMLSRYEEVIVQERDEHDRFPSSASVASRSGFLDRPIVDEYVEVLWGAMRRLWPALKRKTRQPRTLVSCDVDAPYVSVDSSSFGIIKRFGGDVLKRRSLGMALQMAKNSVYRRQGDYSLDPYLNAINWIMDVNEKAGNQVAFYFIASHSHPTLDGCYIIDEPVIRNLLRCIASRGHEIGLHSSYNTYRDAEQTCREADILRNVMGKEGIHQAVLGGRQHFLRWQTSKTANNIEAAGLNYDSTLSFADRSGFRCGTCHEYPMYDLINRCALKLRQRPLILMECTVIAERYMGMGYSKTALETMKAYKQTCRRFGGNFTLLWHNSHLMTLDDRRFYSELVE